MAQLILLGLPLGNMDDLTRRQEKALREGHHFICEDTRNLIKILQILNVSREGKTLWSFHDQSAGEEIDKLVKEIKKVGTVYLVSDAGSPLISDPGYPLIRACLEQGVDIDTYPGPSSPIVALELMGLQPLPFHFHGFFPREKDKRQQKIAEISRQKGTHLFFESPYRVHECADALAQAFPENKIALARELTKLFQTIHRFVGKDWESERPKLEVRGEFVVAVELTEVLEVPNADRKTRDLAQEVLNKKGKAKELAKLLSHLLGDATNEIYQALISK